MIRDVAALTPRAAVQTGPLAPPASDRRFGFPSISTRSYTVSVYAPAPTIRLRCPAARRPDRNIPICACVPYGRDGLFQVWIQHWGARHADRAGSCWSWNTTGSTATGVASTIEQRAGAYVHPHRLVGRSICQACKRLRLRSIGRPTGYTYTAAAPLGRSDPSRSRRRTTSQIRHVLTTQDRVANTQRTLPRGEAANSRTASQPADPVAMHARAHQAPPPQW